jgi:glycosyltransferase involved in cell wall biosynthesis
MNFNIKDYEALVVDNNSNDQTQEFCKSIPSLFPGLNFRYVSEPRQGVAYTRTTAAKEATGEIIAFIDDDCIADINWLKEVIEFYEKHPEVMSTGGCIVPKFLAKKPGWFGKYFWGLVGDYNLGKKEFQMKGVRYPSGANMHFRKAAFKKYGYFDGNLGRSGKSLMAGEEKAMYVKLIKGNEKVFYIPQARVFHHVEENKFDKNYVRLHSMGIGASEYIMNKNSVLKLFIKFMEYIAKLLYAVGYGILYLVSGQPSKMAMLIKFRWWVIEGFLSPAKSR